MATLHCEIITPEGHLFDGEAEMVVVPGAEGGLGVLPRHQPIVAHLDAGEVRVRVPGHLTTPDSTLIPLMQQEHVDLRFEQPRQWLGILLNVLPVILLLSWVAALLGVLVWLGWWAMRRVKVANP